MGEAQIGDSKVERKPMPLLSLVRTGVKRDHEVRYMARHVQILYGFVAGSKTE